MEANTLKAATFGWGVGAAGVVARQREERKGNAGSLFLESCLPPWKPVIHKPNYVQVTCQL